jgi:monoamine oxidase
VAAVTDRRLTRRALVGSAAAGGAAAALPDAALGARRPRQKRADVVVVGAGAAGLVAARELVRKGVRSVVVLEARDRVGGRTWTKPVRGVPVDVGGQWLGPQQRRVAQLARDLGIGTYPTYNTGENVFYRDGARSTYTGAVPTGDPGALPETALAIEQINSMAREVPVDAPWTAASAREWDGQTMETWKRDNVQHPGARFLIDLGIEAVFACEPRDISLLHVLFVTAAAGSFDALINTAGGAQESRFVGGAQQISLRVARELGRRVVLRSPVRRIVRLRGGRVRVESDRMVVTARRAIVALPPAMAARVEYAPALPGLRDQLTQRMPMGSVIKVHAFYERPFWRDEGLTGQATSDTGPCRVTFDNTTPEGAPGVLLGFVEGEEARRWAERPVAERRTAALESFARYFGDAARSPLDYVEQNWAEEPWTRGCYFGFAPPGVLLDYGVALREPIGPLHWAGTETATEWAGYIEGAVQSGERVAAEVAEALA